jgi:pimeloyl-ACP methyl ester carboxylesterase
LSQVIIAQRGGSPSRQWPIKIQHPVESEIFDSARRSSDEGYPPVVEEYESGALNEKPILLCLPGFDGTFMSLFLQLPELSASFDVRCLTMAMNDRSTYEELKASVIDYIAKEIGQENVQKPNEEPANKFLVSLNLYKPKPVGRFVYLVGESFGGILASDVALSILEDDRLKDNIKGMALINAATCYDRSKLASMGPTVGKLPQILYPFGLLAIAISLHGRILVRLIAPYVFRPKRCRV